MLGCVALAAGLSLHTHLVLASLVGSSGRSPLLVSLPEPVWWSLQSFPGHRDAVTGLAFRHGTHELFSCALDRTLKTWSVDDRTYIDTLFGHQVAI